MQYEVEVGGRTRHVAVTRVGGSFAVTVDGHNRHVDAARIDAHTLSLILDSVWLQDTAKAGQDPSDVRRPGLLRPGYEVTIAPDSASGQLTVRVGATPVSVTLNGRRRWGRKDDGRSSGTGPQRLVAPMPGKVVRVLVKTGDSVGVRQSVVVVEAMKMENELRAGRQGTVTEIHAREGMSVEAGALLIVIQ